MIANEKFGGLQLTPMPVALTAGMDESNWGVWLDPMSVSMIQFHEQEDLDSE